MHFIDDFFFRPVDVGDSVNGREGVFELGCGDEVVEPFLDAQVGKTFSALPTTAGAAAVIEVADPLFAAADADSFAAFKTFVVDASSGAAGGQDRIVVASSKKLHDKMLADASLIDKKAHVAQTPAHI